MAGQDGLEPAWWTGNHGSGEIHLVYLLGKLGQEMLLAGSVKPFSFTLAGALLRHSEVPDLQLAHPFLTPAVLAHPPYSCAHV